MKPHFRHYSRASSCSNSYYSVKISQRKYMRVVRRNTNTQANANHDKYNYLANPSGLRLTRQIELFIIVASNWEISGCLTLPGDTTLGTQIWLVSSINNQVIYSPFSNPSDSKEVTNSGMTMANIRIDTFQYVLRISISRTPDLHI
jgi:hypothetical protein